jgi:hypothetical protein
MSGTLPSAYSSPVDFRISQSPPIISNITDVNFAVSDLYAFGQQVIHTFVDIVGIGPQVLPRQAALEGSTSTLTMGNQHRFYVRALENIGLGAIISLTNNAGKIAARNANATNNTRIADGFCSDPGGIGVGQVGEVILITGIAPVGGLIVGQRYWLSTTNGIIQNGPPVAAGNIEQYLGIAIDTTHLLFNCGIWLQH